MQVRVHYGAHVGTVREFPYAVGLAIVEAGRGTRVDVEAAEPIQTVEPMRQHRDPAPPARLGSPRRRDRSRP